MDHQSVSQNLKIIVLIGSICIGDWNVIPCCVLLYFPASCVFFTLVGVAVAVDVVLAGAQLSVFVALMLVLGQQCVYNCSDNEQLFFAFL